MTDRKPAPRRRRRLRWWLLGGVVGLVVVLVGALPWILSTKLARRWLLDRAAETLAPARLDVGSFAFSWFGPTRMTRFVLIDAQGDRVVEAPRAVWDRNLWQILFDRPRLGTLRLDRGRLDIERFPDGTIDLHEALRPILKGPPETSFVVRVQAGSLRLRSPELAEPLRATLTDVVVNRPAAPNPISWRIRLDRPGADEPSPMVVAASLRPGAGTSPSLTIEGNFDRWTYAHDGNHDLNLTIEGQNWPLALNLGRARLEGAFDGRLENARRHDRWRLKGDARLGGFALSGPLLAEDHLRLDQAKGRWNVSQTADGWTLDQLELTSTLGSLQADGPVPAPPGQTSRIKGQLDLASLSRQLPNTFPLRDGWSLDRGLARLLLNGSTVQGHRSWDLEARIETVEAHQNERALRFETPASLVAHLREDASRFTVESLDLETAFLNAHGTGNVDEGVNIQGTIDLAEIHRRMSELIDFGALGLAGRGRLEGSYRREGTRYHGQLGLELEDLALSAREGSGLRRESAQVRLSVSGPAGESGLPIGWGDARGSLFSDDLSASVVSFAKDGELSALTASVAVTSEFGSMPATAEARLVGLRDGTTWAIDEAVVDLHPTHDPSPEGQLEWSLDGVFDPTAGALLLQPTKSRPSSVPAVAIDGLHVQGLNGPNWRAEGRLGGELASLVPLLAVWTGREPPELTGGLSARWSVQGSQEGPVRFGANLRIVDSSVETADGVRALGRFEFDVVGSYCTESDDVSFSELVVVTPYGSLEASGRVADPTGQGLVEVDGTLTPDWEAIRAVLTERVEPGAKISGGSSRFHLRGPVGGGDASAALDAEFGVVLSEADVYGMKLGPAPIVVRLKGDQVEVEPIQTTLNGGRFRLDPRVVRESSGGLSIQLGEGTTIEGAEINDEVSHRVLSFVVPVLDRATRVHGRISAQVERAAFPLDSTLGEGSKVEGRVVFQNVEFLPGPLAEQLVELVGAEPSSMKLNEPVVLSIADGKVHQRGLALPVGRLTQLQIDGDVGFDRRLDLTASVPITPAMVANNPILSDIVAGTRIKVPVGGTLSKPQVDKEAFRTAMQDLGKTLLRRGAVRGATELLMRLTAPRVRPAAEPGEPQPPPRARRRNRTNR